MKNNLKNPTLKDKIIVFSLLILLVLITLLYFFFLNQYGREIEFINTLLEGFSQRSGARYFYGLIIVLPIVIPFGIIGTILWGRNQKDK